MNYIQFQAGVGTIAATWNSRGLLTRIDWLDTVPPETEVGSDVHWRMLSNVGLTRDLENTLMKLKNYFQWGEPIGALSLEQMDQSQWTDFQFKVYSILPKIPHGETRPYAWVAKKIGDTNATRAVGQALRKNPIPILVPCHRVVSQTALGGFMGATDPDQAEVRFKKWLIDLESRYCNPVFSFLEADLSLGFERRTA
jgi:methylated-DNA-[protein]-cysteine S-methyltransferase